MRRIILFLLILSSVNCQESAQYLQNAVRDLRRLNHNRQTLRRVDTLMAEASPHYEAVPVAQRRAHHGSEVVPALSLTKGELQTLYENAVAKGETLKLDTGDKSYINAAVYEIDDHDVHKDTPPKHGASANGDGYYYYYYPIKSFMDDIIDGSSTDIKPWTHPSTTHSPPYQYHSHHHQVKIKMENDGEMKPQKDKKGLLEPLFMAISGFVGMALMVVVSMLILPKFGSSKPKKSLLWHKSKDMDELARLALNAIEGKDCRERFACELTKTARNFNMSNNRFIKLLKRIAPGAFGSEIDRIGKYGDRQLKCTLIPCTRKIIKIQKPVSKKTTTKKKNVAQKKQ